MTAKEQLQQLHANIDEIQQQIGKLNEKSYQLMGQCSTLAHQVLLEEKMLDGTIWSILENQPEYIFAELRGKLSDEVSELIRDSWHSKFRLEDGVDILFNDTRVSLMVKPGVDISTLIKKYGLVIKTDQVQKLMVELKAKLDALQQLTQQLDV